MTDRQEQLIKVFEDTQKFYKENQVLADAVTFGRVNTKLFEADEYPELPGEGLSDGAGEIRISKDKTFEAAMKLRGEFPDQKIAVLNFASATNPGGGVKKGSSAQEESLCRCSTLFPTIDRKWLWQKYYDVNRQANDARYSDACIYSPGVIICKTDESIPKRMEEESFVTVDVITCAAPNLRKIPSNHMNPNAGNAVKMDTEQLYQLQLKRIRHILHIAAYNKVEILVLGAFGCGAFENDPFVVARAFRDAIQEYRNHFQVITFAIYCRDYESDNYKAFKEVLEQAENDGFSNPFLQGNEKIEEAINAFHQEGSKDQMTLVLESLRNRMHEDGQFIIPVLFDDNDPNAFSMQAITTKDGKLWQVAFTSKKEFEKGAPSKVISYFIDATMKACLESDNEVEGFIINP